MPAPFDAGCRGLLRPGSQQQIAGIVVSDRSDTSYWSREAYMSTNERDLIVGGQAVIEGVMMRTPNAYAIAVRKADGTIVNTAAVLPKWSDKLPILKLPVLRGGAVLLQSMGLGIKALNYSRVKRSLKPKRQAPPK